MFLLTILLIGAPRWNPIDHYKSVHSSEKGAMLYLAVWLISTGCSAQNFYDLPGSMSF